MSQYMVGGEAGGESEDSGRPALYGMSLGQLREAAAGLGLPRYAAGQMASWLYRRGCTDIAAMTDLSKAAREALASSYRLGLEAPRSVAVSRDGTKKYLYRTADGHYVESAIFPTRPGHALRLFTGGVPHGVPFLHDGASGASRTAHVGGYSEPDGLATRTRQTYQYGIYGDGGAVG